MRPPRYRAAFMADSDAAPPELPGPDEPDASDGSKRRRKGHTVAQRCVLALNVVVILACFAAAFGLIVLKNVRESFVAAPRVTFDTGLSGGPSTSGLSGSGPTGSQPTGAGPDGPTGATEPGGAPITTVTAATAGPTTPPETFPDPDPRAENFLITGDDNNACVDPDSPWAGAVQNRESIGSRSDTIMVLRLDPVTKAAAVLSFPRDLYVDIPGRAKDRINTAFQKGRYDLMAETLDQNFAVRVDHFVQIDFCAFKTIVDAVGGVSVPFEQPVRDANTGLNITVGGGACHAFVGDEALAYVRSRHLQFLDADGRWTDDGTSDFGRITRQQDFLRRMLRTAGSKGFFNPSVARGLLEAARKYIVFDSGFSIDDMLSFAGLLRSIDPTSIHTYQLQGRGTFVGPNSVLIPQIEGPSMKAILAIFRGTAPLAGAPDQVTDTTTTTAAATSTTTTSVAPTTSTPAVGRVTTTIAGPATATTATTTTRPAATTTTTSGPTTTEAPPPTNPDDITRGVFPDKNIQC